MTEKTKKAKEVETEDTSDFQVTVVDDVSSVKFYQLLRFSDPLDKFLFALGVFGSIVTGVAMPVSLFILSKVVTSFSKQSDEPLKHRFRKFIPLYVSLGAVAFVISFVQMFALTVSARRQSRRIRLLLFKHIMRQNIAWFDRQSTGNLITKLSFNIEQIESGIGDRLGNFVQNIVTSIASIVVSLVLGWKLALVSFAMAPFILGAFILLAFALRKYAIKEIQAYEKAGSVAAEILSSIKTVFAFGCQEKEANRYAKELGPSARVFILKCVMIGFGGGMIGCSINCAASLILWYGIELTITDNYENGVVVAVMMSYIVGNTNLGRGLPEIEYFANAKRAAALIYSIIDRIPPVDVMGDGIIPKSFSGKIEFKNVSFTYPTRPDVPILRNFSLTIQPGETVAIVGPSGSGKSTTVQLLQRFYDCDEGTILLDGMDIRDLDVNWLRMQLGVVSQEPNLFAGTVTENIQMGRLDADTKDVEEAARQADAHNFICALPEGYDTFLTEGGGKLSGGQKQRLAIARALVREPRVLLLDEATSALDNVSERAVQSAIDSACHGRTVLMIAHRLSTVRAADRIVVLDRGIVKESGTHEELIALGGIYAGMVAKQPGQGSPGEEEENESSDDDDDALSGDTKRSASRHQSQMSETDGASSIASEMSVLGVKRKKPALIEALQMCRPEWYYLTYGLVAIALSGITLPAFSLVYAEVYGVFLKQDPSAKRSRTSFLAGIFALLGFLRLFFNLTGQSALGVSGARLTKRARQLFFDSILKQEMAWFDEEENQPGMLTARLATEVQSLHRVTGTQLGIFMEGLALVVSALVIAFSYNWALSLIALAFVPALFLAGALQTRQISGGGGLGQVEGSNVAQEAFTANRTVAAFGLQNFMYDKFRNATKNSVKSRYAQAILFAFVHSLANGTFFFLFAAYFYTAATLYDRNEVELQTMFRIFSAVNFAAQGLGRAATFAPDFMKASMNIKKTLATIHRQTKMDVNEGDFPPEPPRGRFEFRNVYFRYPTRRKFRILKKFSHVVEPGTSVAMVGPSGCGKSTVLQLVQRLYDVENHGDNSGIFLDNRDLRELAPNWIRSHIGVVSQEPNLFNLSIRENIAYGRIAIQNSEGKIDFREPTMDEIVEAAKQANIHNFISSLPEGYETNVGVGGSQLSGGQKQRVAIARALVRQPRVLLLDEATSALDVESERIVQNTLDEAMRRGAESGHERTSLVVAHRLTTVMKCDEIVVLMGGKSIESGSPNTLLQKHGAFYELQKASVGAS